MCFNCYFSLQKSLPSFGPYLQTKTQALAKYKKILKDASGNVITDTSDARVNIPKTPIPNVKVSIISPFGI